MSAFALLSLNGLLTAGDPADISCLSVHEVTHIDRARIRDSILRNCDVKQLYDNFMRVYYIVILQKKMEIRDTI